MLSGLSCYLPITSNVITFLRGYLLQESLHKRVAESEGGSGKAVDDGRVDGGVVLVVVPIRHWQDVELCHVLRAKHNWQPFVVRDVLGSETQVKAIFLITVIN